jgi:hypothetical protein
MTLEDGDVHVMAADDGDRGTGHSEGRIGVMNLASLRPQGLAQSGAADDAHVNLLVHVGMIPSAWATQAESEQKRAAGTGSDPRRPELRIMVATANLGNRCDIWTAKHFANSPWLNWTRCTGWRCI